MLPPFLVGLQVVFHRSFQQEVADIPVPVAEAIVGHVAFIH